MLGIDLEDFMESLFKDDNNFDAQKFLTTIFDDPGTSNFG